MKKIIFTTLILLSLQSCSQKNDNMINQNLDITANNIVEKITQEIKHYPSEKIYKFSYNNEMVYFNVYIDDVLAYRQFRLPQSGSAFEINNVIFNKGQHKVYYQLFPIGITKEYEEDYKTLTDDTNLNLKLKSYDLQNKELRDIEYTEYSIPKIKEEIAKDYFKEKFQGTGKTYYEGSFDINVDVPYELHPPFKNAQDLRKMDKKELEVKLVKEYNKIRNIYQNKEKDNIAKLVYDNLKMQLVTDYATKEQVKEAWDEINEILFKSEIEILPIENYKMQFFAEGKLVALFTDGSNPKIRGGNAVVCNVKSGNHGKGFIELKHFFYIPQGETEFKVY